MKILLGFALFFMFACSDSSTSASDNEVFLSGYVQERLPNFLLEPIPSATVSAGGKKTTSDDEGFFNFDLEHGTYDVTATKEGFEDYSSSVTISEDVDGHHFTLLMERSKN